MPLYKAVRSFKSGKHKEEESEGRGATQLERFAYLIAYGFDWNSETGARWQTAPKQTTAPALTPADDLKIFLREPERAGHYCIVSARRATKEIE